MRVIGRRILGFTVKDRQRTDGSIIYKGNSRDGNVNGSQVAWVWHIGSTVRADLHRGQKVYLTDGFELDETRDMHHLVEADPEFNALREYAALTEGRIKTVIFHELSVLAVET